MGIARGDIIKFHGDSDLLYLVMGRNKCRQSYEVIPCCEVDYEKGNSMEYPLEILGRWHTLSISLMGKMVCTYLPKKVCMVDELILQDVFEAIIDYESTLD